MIALPLIFALTLLVVISVIPCWPTTVTYPFDLDTMEEDLKKFWNKQGESTNLPNVDHVGP